MLNSIKDFCVKLHNKLSITSNRFILITTLYFGFILNIAFWNFVLTNIVVNSFSVFLFLISLLFFISFPLYLLFNLIIVPYIGKPLVIILLLLSSSANFFMYNYGVYIDADMIRNVFETNQREALDLFTLKFCLIYLLTGILPAIIVAFTKINYSSLKQEAKHRTIYTLIGLCIIGVFAGTSFKEYASFGRNNREVRKLINTLNYNYAIVRYFKNKHY